jgi:hypothetical protein
MYYEGFLQICAGEESYSNKFSYLACAGFFNKKSGSTTSVARWDGRGRENYEKIIYIRVGNTRASGQDM